MGAALLLWLARSLLVSPLTQWLEQPLVQTVPGSRLSVMEASGRISSSALLASSRWSHLEIWTLPSPSYLPSGVWVLPVEYAVFGTRAILGSTVDTCSTGGFRRISAFLYVAVNSNPEAFFLHSV